MEPGQPVELPDSNDVAFAELVEHAIELWAVPVRSRDLFPEDFATSCLFEDIELKSQSLVFCRDASVANFHSAVTKPFAKYIAMETGSARYFREADLADFKRVCAFRETYKFCDSAEHVGGYLCLLDFSRMNSVGDMGGFTAR